MKNRNRKDNFKRDFRISILRKLGEGFKLIDNSDVVSISIFGIKNGKVKIGINAPKNMDINLKEKVHIQQTELSQQLEAYHINYRRQCQEELMPYSKQLTSLNQDSLNNVNTINLKPTNLMVDKDNRKVKVLLVEDSAIIRQVNSEILQKLDCQVDIAEDGRQAFDLLQNKYDLILLDIGLPDISGIEICKSIRNCGINQNTPVVFLTASGDSYRKKCQLVGGNDFAVKPVLIDKFRKIVRRWG